MGYANKHAVRVQAYEILLVTIRILNSAKQPYQKFLPLLSDGINLQPFYAEDAEPLPCVCKQCF
jgi:hypothetical protein